VSATQLSGGLLKKSRAPGSVASTLHVSALELKTRDKPASSIDFRYLPAIVCLRWDRCPVLSKTAKRPIFFARSGFIVSTSMTAGLRGSSPRHDGISMN
jgi:hypothetical protein